MPAPSPVFASQPQAPRCCRLISTCEAARDHGVGTAAGDVHDEPDAARVVFERRIIQTAAAVSIGVFVGTRPLWQTVLRSAK